MNQQARNIAAMHDSTVRRVTPLDRLLERLDEERQRPGALAHVITTEEARQLVDALAVRKREAG